jgi:SulP family sulfate permease
LTSERGAGASKARWLEAHRGDLAGGLGSAALAVGGNVAVGVIAFAPLGDEYVSLGVLAGMLTSIVGGFAASLTGGAPGFIVGPKMTTAMIFAGIMTNLAAGDVADPSLLPFAFGAVLMSGCLQFGLGALGFGELGKFIPYPVVAGIRTATALLLIYGQLWAAIGVQRTSIAEYLSAPQVQWGTLLVAATTAAVMFWGGKIVPRLKPVVPIVALVMGTALYQLLVTSGVGPLGPTLQTLSLGVAPPAFGQIVTKLGNPSLLVALISGAFAMALLDAMALLSLVAFQDVARDRFDGNGQLRGQGIGTVASALVGGLSTSGILARAMMNHNAGGRTKLSGVFHSVFVLLLGILVATSLGLVPKAAVAGLILVLAFRLFDPWAGTQLSELRRADAFLRRDNASNIAQLLVVVLVGVGANLVWRGYGLVFAVGAGVVVSVFAFAFGMARDPFRGDPRIGKAARSFRQRFGRFEQILDADGTGVALIRLKGAIFFGTCDKIVEKIDDVVAQLPDDVERLFVVLDLDRVPTVDATGYKVLGQTHTRLRSRVPPIDLGFSFVTPGGRRKEVAEELLAVGVPPENMFFSSDHALEHFEEEVIRSRDHYAPREDGWIVRDFGNTWGLTAEE